jgi:hypothetical protein
LTLSVPGCPAGRLEESHRPLTAALQLMGLSAPSGSRAAGAASLLRREERSSYATDEELDGHRKQHKPHDSNGDCSAGLP